MGLKCGVLGKFSSYIYPWRQKKKDICLHPMGILTKVDFNQHNERISCHPCFCQKKLQFLYFSKFQFIIFFENISKSASKSQSHFFQPLKATKSSYKKVTSFVHSVQLSRINRLITALFILHGHSIDRLIQIARSPSKEEFETHDSNSREP